MERLWWWPVFVSEGWFNNLSKNDPLSEQLSPTKGVRWGLPLWSRVMWFWFFYSYGSITDVELLSLYMALEWLMVIGVSYPSYYDCYFSFIFANSLARCSYIFWVSWFNYCFSFLVFTVCGRSAAALYPFYDRSKKYAKESSIMDIDWLSSLSLLNFLPANSTG